MSKILERLRKNDKKGIFDFGKYPLKGYPTGFLPFDFANGYVVGGHEYQSDGLVPTLDGIGRNLVNGWFNIGLFSGTFITIVGNSGTGKTTFAVQAGTNIIKLFPDADFFHFDGEGSSNEDHILDISKLDPNEFEYKYHYIPDVDYVEDVFTFIYDLAVEKLNSKEYIWETNLTDAKGNKLQMLQPTIVLIDALPSLQTKEVENSNMLNSQTYNMRLAIAYNAFYKRLRPIIRDANILVIAINHIKEKPDMGFQKTQAKIQYLKPGESIPGGSGPIYLSQNLLRFIYQGKCTTEKHGFEGFLTTVELVKSKTNRSGRLVNLVFDYDHGFDQFRTMVKYAKDNELIGGRNPYCFFKSNPEIKFDSRNLRSEVAENKDLQKAMINSCIPSLAGLLSNSARAISNGLDNMAPDELQTRLDNSYENLHDMDKNMEAEDL